MAIVLETEINGTIPKLNKKDYVAYKDFKQAYNYRKDENSNNHIIESNGEINYKIMPEGNPLPQESFEISYHERIDFTSCHDYEELGGNPDVLIDLKDLVVLYERDSLRFVQNHLLLPKNESSNPCDENNCSDLAVCYVDSYKNSFYCVCKNGFSGDGLECIDQNECESEMDLCSVEATCINNPGFFECRCNPPYVGNGRECVIEVNNNEADLCANCHPNAQCMNGRCECIRGYYGNGYVCQQDYVQEERPEEPVVVGLDCNNCDVNAQCVNHDNKAGTCCVCNEGYVGNGKYCFYEGMEFYFLFYFELII